MTFTSLIFLLFLPIVLVVYWALRKPKIQNVWLVAASYFFYGWWDWRFCLLMAASSLVDYLIGPAIERSSDKGVRKRLLLVSLISNLGLLGVFKYFNFFVESFRDLGAIFGLDMNTGTFEIILPVGISFYTFQTLSYTIDIYRGQLKPTRNLFDYLAFVSFFPQLVAGPIERAAHMLPQFHRLRKFRWEDIREGSRYVLWGFFKKIVIADTLASSVTAAYSNPAAATGPELTLATVFFAFQIYCDFSAYSEIAIGTARMFGVELMRNFAYPYFSQSPQEFWRRWHISLSTWFRDYVYIPLGGSRGSARRTNFNLVTTFLVSGLWHGAAWKFIAWGGLHGAALIGVHRRTDQPSRPFEIDRPGGARLFPDPGTLARMAATFVTVCLFWVFFRASSMGDSLMIIGKMVREAFSFSAYGQIIQDYRAGNPVYQAINLVLVFVAVEWLRRGELHPLHVGHWPKPIRWVIYSVVFWFVVEFAEKTPSSPFIYFQF